MKVETSFTELYDKAWEGDRILLVCPYECLRKVIYMAGEKKLILRRFHYGVIEDQAIVLGCPLDRALEIGMPFLQEEFGEGVEGLLDPSGCARLELHKFGDFFEEVGGQTLLKSGSADLILRLMKIAHPGKSWQEAALQGGHHWKSEWNSFADQYMAEVDTLEDEVNSWRSRVWMKGLYQDLVQAMGDFSGRGLEAQIEGIGQVLAYSLAGRIMLTLRSADAEITLIDQDYYSGTPPLRGGEVLESGSRMGVQSYFGTRSNICNLLQILESTTEISFTEPKSICVG